MAEWGRKDYSKAWPSRTPVWTWTAILASLVFFAGMLTVEYERSWTAAERLYLTDYLKSGARGKASATAAGKYTLLEAVVGKGQRLVIGDEIEEVPSLDGRPGYRLTEEGVKDGIARLTWVTGMFNDRGLHRVMSQAVYADHESLEFYKKPFYETLAFLALALFLSVPRDRKRRMIWKHGRRLRGPELVTTSEFNEKLGKSKSGLDYFGARYYGSNMGRFMSPDPLGGHLENPQSLNKYAYALNNPLTNTDPTGLDSYLQCTQTKDNASTCQSQTVGYDKNGKAQTATVQGVTGKNGFTATLIGNDANGNLVDKTTGTGSYTASVNGSGVQFSNNGGQSSSSGVFVNGTPQTTFQDAGFAIGGALSGFQFTLTNSKLEANQTEAGSFSFSFNGTSAQAGAALQRAGFSPRYGMENGDEYRSSGSGLTGANSGHFIVTPNASVPTAGTMHFGEHSFGFNPLSDILHFR